MMNSLYCKDRRVNLRAYFGKLEFGLNRVIYLFIGWIVLINFGYNLTATEPLAGPSLPRLQPTVYALAAPTQ